MRRVLLALAALTAASCFQAVTEVECLRDSDCDAGRCLDGFCGGRTNTGGGSASIGGGSASAGGGVGASGGGTTNPGGGTGATGGGSGATGGGTTNPGGGNGATGGGTNTCNGCTSVLGCQPGDNALACGSGGAQCTTCGFGEQCVNGACVMAGCGPQSCDGCCLQGVCLPTDTQTRFSCGANGTLCMQCPQGSSCVNGSCQTTSTCSSTCSGCCDGTTCRGGFTSLACGSNGNACQQCGMGTACVNGSCVPVFGSDAGTAAVRPGSPCTASSECQPPQNAQCIPETLPGGQSTGYVGGYCTRQCTAVGCGPGAVCVTETVFGSTQSTCRQSCATASACRPGYVCQLAANGAPYCRPDCNNGGLLSGCGQNQTCTANGTCQ